MSPGEGVWEGASSSLQACLCTVCVCVCVCFVCDSVCVCVCVCVCVWWWGGAKSQRALTLRSRGGWAGFLKGLPR